MTVQISESELRRLSTDSKTQQRNINDIVTGLHTAIQGTDWRSDAAESYKARWASDEKILLKLSEDLQNWGKLCDQQADVARAVNGRIS